LVIVGLGVAGFSVALLVLRPRTPEPDHVVPAAAVDAGQVLAVVPPVVSDAGSEDAGDAGLFDAEEPSEPEITSEGEEPETSEPEPKHGASPRHRPAPRPVSGALTLAESRTLLQEARNFLSAQRFDDARAVFERLVQSGKNRGPALVGLAKIAFQKQSYQEAVERAQAATKAGGGVEARVLLGDAYFRLEKFAEARKAYEAALKLDPENRTARQNLDLVERRGN
jgi:tetratricopeptide (TPR) repeat protein